MKPITFALCALVAVLVGCSKKQQERAATFSDGTLQGTWIFTEQNVSIGGPGEWRPVQPANQTITFQANGSFTPTASFLPGTTQYEVLDSARIKFTPAQTPAGYLIMKYAFAEKNNVLLLHALDPMCIEGCSYKFARSNR